MRRVPVVREDLRRFSSHGVVAHQPAESPEHLVMSSGPASLVVMTMTTGAVIGRHAAVGPQLLQVGAGSVRVVGGDRQSVTLRTGECVMFDDGEQHDTSAVTDAVLAIMQWRAEGSTPKDG